MTGRNAEKLGLGHFVLNNCAGDAPTDKFLSEYLKVVPFIKNTFLKRKSPVLMTFKLVICFFNKISKTVIKSLCVLLIG